MSQTGENKGFAVFSDRIYGTRAADRLLANYGAQNINTVNDIISRFAPPTENDTENYINRIVEDTGYDRDKRLDLANRNVRLPLLKAMAKMETGVILDDRDIMAAQNFNFNGSLNEPFSDDILNAIALDENIKTFTERLSNPERNLIDNSLASFSGLQPLDPISSTSIGEQEPFFARGDRSFGELYDDAIYSGALSKELIKIFRKKGYQVIGFTQSKTNREISSERPNDWIEWKCGKELKLTNLQQKL